MSSTPPEQVVDRWTPIRCFYRRPDFFVQGTRLVGQPAGIELQGRIEDVPDANRTIHRFACNRKDLGNHVNRILACLHSLTVYIRERTKLRIGQTTNLIVPGRDFLDDVQVPLDHPLVAGTEDHLSDF